MRKTHLTILAILVIGISASLSDPAPCSDDLRSSRSEGQASCRQTFSRHDARSTSYEDAIEKIASPWPIDSFDQLARHVVDVSQQALGYSSVVTDDTLAELAWIFRLRHMPEPVIFARTSTKYDAARTVRFVLTQSEVQKMHHFTEYQINQLISDVEASVERSHSFVFRIITGASSEYFQIGTHQLASRMHIFAAVHTNTELKVTYVGTEIMGEFIKGHGGKDATTEREETATFLKQWLLNQWVNIWSCTNPDNT